MHLDELLDKTDGSGKYVTYWADATNQRSTCYNALQIALADEMNQLFSLTNVDETKTEDVIPPAHDYEGLEGSVAVIKILSNLIGRNVHEIAQEGEGKKIMQALLEWAIRYGQLVQAKEAKKSNKWIFEGFQSSRPRIFTT